MVAAYCKGLYRPGKYVCHMRSYLLNLTTVFASFRVAERRNKQFISSNQETDEQACKQKTGNTLTEEATTLQNHVFC